MNSLVFEEKLHDLLGQFQDLVFEHHHKTKPTLDVNRDLSDSSKQFCIDLAIQYTQIMKNINRGNFENQKTQQREHEYKHIFRSLLEEKGLNFKEAGSQQPVDFRIQNPNDKQIIGFELKSTTSNKIMCNDTFPEPFIFYIILHSKTKRVSSCFGNELLNDSVSSSTQKLFEQTLSFMKNELFRKNGNLHTYVRPNYQINITHLSFL
jgi:hypothetical protein